MAREVMAQAVDAEPFIAGFLTKTLDAGKAPDYGYHANHLPATSGKEVEMESLLALIAWGEDR